MRVPLQLVPSRVRLGHTGRGRRFFAYGLAGWCAEVAYTGVHDFLRSRDPRLPSRTSLWMFPIYGLASPLFEPFHEALRGKPVVLRATAYGCGFMSVEYATGSLLRHLIGDAPWDYSDAPFQVDGLVRLDYLPLWAAAGLAVERLHDALETRRPSSGTPADEPVAEPNG